MSENFYEPEPTRRDDSALPTLPGSNYPTLPGAGQYATPPPPPSLAIPFDPYASATQPQTKRRIPLMVFIGGIVVLIAVVGVLGVLLFRATIVPTAQYPFSTNLVLNDPLRDESHAVTYGWALGNGGNGGCAFNNGAYEVIAQQDYLYCPSHSASFSNFTYEIQMRIKTGGMRAMGGVIFRHTLGTGKNYMFLLGTDGTYALDMNTSYSGGSTLRSGTIFGFATGINRLHTIGIVANGPAISVYVDQKYIFQVSDSTYSSGVIGMLSQYGSSSTTVAFTNARVWQL